MKDRPKKQVAQDVYDRIHTAKTLNVPAAQVWRGILIGLKNSGMRPSGIAMAKATYWGFMLKVYGAALPAYLLHVSLDDLNKVN